VARESRVNHVYHTCDKERDLAWCDVCLDLLRVILARLKNHPDFKGETVLIETFLKTLDVPVDLA